MKTIKLPKTQVVRVAFDPAFDLNENGQPTDEADSLQAALEESVSKVASECGIEIEPIFTVYGSPEAFSVTKTEVKGYDRPLEMVLWQAAFDGVTRHQDGTWAAL